MAEYASKRMRGAFLAAVYAMQGVGVLLGSTVALVVSAVVPEADYVWRAILMFGAVPAACAFYLRTKLPETTRYTALVVKDPKRVAADISRVLRASIQEQEIDVGGGSDDDEWGLFSVQFMKRHGLHLLATSSAWFLLDVTYYSQNILQKDLLSKRGWFSPSPSATMDAVEEVSRLARALALIALCGAVPGYWFAVALIDVLGRRRLQLAGFLMMTLSMLALAASYDHWMSPSPSFIPKKGVVLGSFGFIPKKGSDGEYAAGISTRNELFVLAGTNFLGMLMTLFVPETKGASLEVLSKEVVYDYDAVDMTV